jgi:hypothetical protein
LDQTPVERVGGSASKLAEIHKEIEYTAGERDQMTGASARRSSES